MITRLKSDYTDLFEAANERLKRLAPENDESFQIPTIESIEEYFSHLRDLVYGYKDYELDPYTSAGKAMIEEGYKFLRLPVDEPVLWIDANTRTISKKIKENTGEWIAGQDHPFFKHGISMQGDEVAEIVFFEIDRFYDATDLGSEQINIAIQWEIQDKDDKQVYSDYTDAFIKVLTDKGTIVFGWPIGTEITNHCGNLKFSVRFYQKGADDLVYSFSTHYQTVVINPTLLVDVTQDSLENKVDLILNRLQNSIFSGQAAPASFPYYVFAYPYLGENGYEGSAILGDEDGFINEDITLYRLASKEETGSMLSYKWIFIDNQNPNNPVELTDGFVELNSQYKYIKTDKFWDNIDLYYLYSSENDTYSVIPGGRIFDETQYNEKKAEYGEGVDFYIKVSSYTLKRNDLRSEINPNGILSSGKIYVDVKNTYYNSDAFISETPAFTNSYWEIIGPEMPVITKDLVNEIIIENDDPITLQIEAENSEKAQYTWYRADERDSEEWIEISNNSIYTIPRSLSTEGYYKVSVTNVKNGGIKPAYSNICFVNYKLDELNENDVQFEIRNYEKMIILTLNRQHPNYEKIECQWIADSATITTTVPGTPDENNPLIYHLPEELGESNLYKVYITITKKGSAAGENGKEPTVTTQKTIYVGN